MKVKRVEEKKHKVSIQKGGKFQIGDAKGISDAMGLMHLGLMRGGFRKMYLEKLRVDNKSHKRRKMK